MNEHNTLLTVEQYEAMATVLVNTVLGEGATQEDVEAAAQWTTEVLDEMLHAAGINTIAAAAIVVPEYII